MIMITLPFCFQWLYWISLVSFTLYYWFTYFCIILNLINFQGSQIKPHRNILVVSASLIIRYQRISQKIPAFLVSVSNPLFTKGLQCELQSSCVPVVAKLGSEPSGIYSVFVPCCHNTRLLKGVCPASVVVTGWCKSHITTTVAVMSLFCYLENSV